MAARFVRWGRRISLRLDRHRAWPKQPASTSSASARCSPATPSPCAARRPPVPWGSHLDEPMVEYASGAKAAVRRRGHRDVTTPRSPSGRSAMPWCSREARRRAPLLGGARAVRIGRPFSARAGRHALHNRTDYDQM